MKNMGDLMKAAQQMQARMAETQAKLKLLEVEGQSGGGMVRIAMNGEGRIVRVTIDRSVLSPDDAGLVEDLILAAGNDAKAKLDTKVQEEMQAVAGGMGLPPGLKLPF
jgi:DNA-binding YbaB/EbfC family protein